MGFQRNCKLYILFAKCDYLIIRTIQHDLSFLYFSERNFIICNYLPVILYLSWYQSCQNCLLNSQLKLLHFKQTNLTDSQFLSRLKLSHLKISSVFKSSKTLTKNRIVWTWIGLENGKLKMIRNIFLHLTFTACKNLLVDSDGNFFA